MALSENSVARSLTFRRDSHVNSQWLDRTWRCGNIDAWALMTPRSVVIELNDILGIAEVAYKI